MFILDNPTRAGRAAVFPVEEEHGAPGTLSIRGMISEHGGGGSCARGGRGGGGSTHPKKMHLPPPPKLISVNEA